MKNLLKPSLNWLLIFVPITIGLELLQPESHTLIFVFACLAIIPLAGLLGQATEHLAEKTGEGVGGLLNATFGNAAELIIAVMALRQGLYGVVKASLTGSIIGNILLVAGAAFLAGGVKYETQRFNQSAARSQSTMLSLAAISLIAPAAFHHISGVSLDKEHGVSLAISAVLVLTYALGLYFSLHTHKKLFQGVSGKDAGTVIEADEPHHKPWTIGRSLGQLAVATAFIAWVSEILVGSVEPAAHAFGMTNVFIGIIVVAIIGNAAEHSTAILVAMKNRMDLALSIATGSSIQIALFVAPLLVFASYLIGPQPMDLVFTPVEVLAVVVSVAIAGQISGDGESNWLEGVQLLSVYLILGIVFFFLPETAAH